MAIMPTKDEIDVDTVKDKISSCIQKFKEMSTLSISEKKRNFEYIMDHYDYFTVALKPEYYTRIKQNFYRFKYYIFFTLFSMTNNEVLDEIGDKIGISYYGYQFWSEENFNKFINSAILYLEDFKDKIDNMDYSFNKFEIIKSGLIKGYKYNNETKQIEIEWKEYNKLY